RMPFDTQLCRVTVPGFFLFFQPNTAPCPFTTQRYRLRRGASMSEEKQRAATIPTALDSGLIMIGPLAGMQSTRQQRLSNGLLLQCLARILNRITHATG